MSLNSVTFGKQNYTVKGYQKSKNNKKHAINTHLNSDEFIYTSNDTSFKKVDFKEGVSLIGKGFVNKIKGIITSIVKHPIKTALAVGATSLLIAGAPLIGITSATAGAALALGFGAYALGKTAIDVSETIKDNKAQRYDEVREDLQKLGGDGVDLALSLPFAPKAIKQIVRFVKYGKNTVGINAELISNIKSNHGLKGIKTEFAKADTLINYEMIGNEMGLAVKPKLVFKDLPADLRTGIFGGAYEPTTGELQINQNILTGKGKVFAKCGGLKNTEVIMRHELEHFKQFSDIARAEDIGINGLGEAITQYYNEALEKIPMEELERQGFSKETILNMTQGNKSALNRKLYQNVIDKQGTIKAGTQEAKMAAKYRQGLLEKINPSEENLAEFNEATKGIDGLCGSPADQMKLFKAQMKLYKSNILEKEAFKAQDKFTASVIKGRPTVVNDALMADSTIEEG